MRASACVPWIVLAAGCFASAIAGEPSLYHACGMTPPGRPTTEQVLCLAQGIGVPSDPERFVVRPGYDRATEEPTVDVLHRRSIRDANGSSETLDMKLSVSEIDGKILSYEPVHEALDLPVDEEISVRDAPLPFLAAICGFEKGASMTERVARCIARAVGLEDGLSGIHVLHDETGPLGTPAWEIGNTFASAPCYRHGTRLVVDAATGYVLQLGWNLGSAAHDPHEEHQVLRPMRM